METFTVLLNVGSAIAPFTYPIIDNNLILQGPAHSIESIELTKYVQTNIKLSEIPAAPRIICSHPLHFKKSSYDCISQINSPGGPLITPSLMLEDGIVTLPSYKTCCDIIYHEQTNTATLSIEYHYDIEGHTTVGTWIPY